MTDKLAEQVTAKKLSFLTPFLRDKRMKISNNRVAFLFKGDRKGFLEKITQKS